MKTKLIKEENHYTLETQNERIGTIILATSDHELSGLLNHPNKLSLKNCQALANGYDLDELAREVCDITDPLRLDSQKYKQDPYFKIGFIKGFQKALEILGDKKFSEEELKNSLILLLSEISCSNGSLLEKTPNEAATWIKNHIQSLQKTEWDVIVEMEVVSDFDSRAEIDGQVFSTNKKVVPKLDANDCLILKRIEL